MHKTAAGLMIMILSTFVMTGCGKTEKQQDTGIKIGVTVYDQYDTFLSQMMQCFDECVAEKKNGGMNIAVEMYDAAASQKNQNEQVKEMITDGCRVICVNLVDRTAPTTIIDQARKNDVAVIFFNRELVEEDLAQWDRLYYVGAEASESGRMQGELATTACRADRSIDRNGDGSIQYVVLEGEAGHQDAIIRTEYAVDTMISSGILLDKVGYAIANWNRSQAQTKMEQLIEQNKDRIELVLANNDDMALGAIDAYKASGLPLSKRPVIFGIDGTDVGLEAVKQDEIVGTVYNDKEGQASAMLELACAIASGKDPEYLSMKDGKYIRLPYQKVTAANVNFFLPGKRKGN